MRLRNDGKNAKLRKKLKRKHLISPENLTRVERTKAGSGIIAIFPGKE
jgi:hypothetical protein